MTQIDNTYYLNSVGYAAVPTRAPNAVISAGQIVRQSATPTAGNERCYICIIAGTASSSTDPTWTFGRGDLVVDGTVTWQECTGQSAVNGDAVNTLTWGQAAGLGTVYNSIGQIIRRNSGTSYHINKTGSFSTFPYTEPAFSDTAGTTVTDVNGCVWTSLGPVSNYTNIRAPHALFRNAISTNWFNNNYPGGTIYIADNHAEMSTVDAGFNGYNGGGTNAAYSVNKFLCHDHTANNPPTAANLMSGATISTNVGFFFNPSHGSYYFYGIVIKAGVGSSSGVNIVFNVSSFSAKIYLKNCSLQLNSTATSYIRTGNGSTGWSLTTFDNTTVRFNNTTDYIDFNVSELVWQNTGPVLVIGSAVPAVFMRPTYQSTIVLEAINLSQLTGTIYSAAPSNNWPPGRIMIKDCKLNAAATIAAGMNITAATVQVVRSDSDVAGYRSDRYSLNGTETTEISIVRTGGAIDPAGQVQSRKIVTTTYPSWIQPFLAEPYAMWNSLVGVNVTVTVCGLVNGTLPLSDEIFIDVEYIGSASTLGNIINTTKSSVLDIGTAVASDNSVWNSPAIIATAWNPADKSASAVVGGTGNLTLSASAGGNQGTRSLNPLSTGKIYFEITINTAVGGSGGCSGIAKGGVAPDQITANPVNGGSVVIWTNGNIYAPNNTGLSLGALTNGNVICIAVDIDAKLIWFRKNAGGNWNNSATANPATRSGGISFYTVTAPYYVFGGTSNGTESSTANFGATSFVGVVPSGFASGWVNTYTPFKLVATINPGLPGYIHVRPRITKPVMTYYLDPQITLGTVNFTRLLSGSRAGRGSSSFVDNGGGKTWLV